MSTHAANQQEGQAILKHSRPGILAFVIAEILFLFIILFFTYNAIVGTETMSDQAREVGELLFRWFYFLLPLSCVLSIIGMGHRYRRKLFGAMALGTNVITIVILISLFMLLD